MSIVEEKLVADVVHWLENAAKQQQSNVVLFPQGARLHNLYMQIPASSGSLGTVWERVEALQKVEDAWNDQEPEPKVTVSLVPVDDIVLE